MVEDSPACRHLKDLLGARRRDKGYALVGGRRQRCVSQVRGGRALATTRTRDTQTLRHKPEKTKTGPAEDAASWVSVTTPTTDRPHTRLRLASRHRVLWVPLSATRHPIGQRREERTAQAQTRCNKCHIGPALSLMTAHAQRHQQVRRRPAGSVRSALPGCRPRAHGSAPYR